MSMAKRYAEPYRNGYGRLDKKLIDNKLGFGYNARRQGLSLALLHIFSVISGVYIGLNYFVDMLTVTTIFGILYVDIEDWRWYFA